MWLLQRKKNRCDRQRTEGHHTGWSEEGTLDWKPPPFPVRVVLEPPLVPSQASSAPDLLASSTFHAHQASGTLSAGEGGAGAPVCDAEPFFAPHACLFLPLLMQPAKHSLPRPGRSSLGPHTGTGQLRKLCLPALDLL